MDGNYYINKNDVDENGILTIPNGYKEVVRDEITTLDYLACLSSIKKIVFSDSIEEIGEFAFEGSINLEEVTIPKTIKKIKCFAFKNCKKLKKVNLNNSINFDITVFENCSNIKEINYNKKYFEFNIFDEPINLIEVAKRNLILSYNNFSNYIIVHESGTELRFNNDKLKKLYDEDKFEYILNWEEAYTSKNGVLDIDSFCNLDSSIISRLPATKGNGISIKQNITSYKNICKKYDINNIMQPNLFVLCFSLGLFCGNKEYSKYIEDIIVEKLETKKINVNNIDIIFDKFNLKNGFNKNSSILLMKALNDVYFQNNLEEIHKIYNEYEQIKRFIDKEYKEIIGRKLIGKIKQLSSKESISKEEKEELNILNNELETKKYNIKHPGLDEIKYYIKNNALHIKKGNEELKQILPFLKNVDQETFDYLQDVFEKSKNIDKKFVQTRDNNKENFSYQWSKGDNPYNLALGYIVNCCAKIGAIGQDIMIQTMINPNIQCLIFRDRNQNIIGKSTVYFNEEEKYLLFNNVECSDSFVAASNESDREEVIITLKRAISDQITALKEKGIVINDVRVGMVRNDLINTQDFLIEKENLLKNYLYKEYEGDANDPECGQAVIYRNNKFEEKIINIKKQI